MDETLNNLAHFEVHLTNGKLFDLFVDAESTVGAKWVDVDILDGKLLVLKVRSKKPRASKEKGVT